MTPQGDGSKSFFGTLLDVNFTTFLTLKFLKVIYILVLIGVALGGFLFFLSSLTRGASGFVFGLIITPLGMLFYLILARIYLEVLALLFRIGENTQAIRQSLGGSDGGSFGGAYQQSYHEPHPQQPPHQQRPHQPGPPLWMQQ